MSKALEKSRIAFIWHLLSILFDKSRSHGNDKLSLTETTVPKTVLGICENMVHAVAANNVLHNLA